MNIDRDMLLRVNRIAGIGSIVIGLAVMPAAGIWALHMWTFTRDAAVVAGHVVANVEKDWRSTSNTGSTTGPTHRSYCAVVHCVDRSGNARSYRDDICFNPASFRVGAPVTVRYDPANPMHVAIDRGEKVFLIPLVVAIVGALCVVGGVQRLAAAGCHRPLPRRYRLSRLTHRERSSATVARSTRVSRRLTRIGYATLGFSVSASRGERGVALLHWRSRRRCILEQP